MSRRKRFGIALLGFVIIVTGFNAVYIWFPRSDAPARADVVMAIGGANSEGRLQQGIALVRKGYAPLLVTDIPSESHCRAAVHIVCFHPEPFTTQGEARYLADQARAHDWHSVLLVLSRDQATRARLRFRRCYGGGLRVITVPTGMTVLFQTGYEDAAMVKAETLQRGC